MENAGEFWKLLIYLVKKRESDYLEHLKKPENKKKTIEEVEAEFNKNNPDILQGIGDLWNRILDKPGSEINRKQELIAEYLEIGNAYNFDPST